MRHTTHSVFMVPPTDFCFNEQTGADNEFQKKLDTNPEMLREDAIGEFNQTVNILRDNFVEVLVLNKTTDEPKLPDAVFPNNWFSTDTKGLLTIYPMKTANRQAEIRPNELKALAEKHNYRVSDIKDISRSEQILEGTGSIIFDHKNKIAYAALSARCEKECFEKEVTSKGYQAISFETQSSNGKPFYHTNVMLSIGEGFTAVCLDAIVAQDRESVLDSFKSSHKQVIELSLEQTENSFCANILQLRNSRGELLIAMSDSAYHGFTQEQKNLLKLHGKLVPCPIDTIEIIGGGSVRCMLAENFLPQV